MGKTHPLFDENEKFKKYIEAIGTALESDFGSSIAGSASDGEEAGDTLALFVVRELADTFDNEASLEDQKAVWERAIQMAIRDLNTVSNAIDKLT